MPTTPRHHQTPSHLTLLLQDAAPALRGTSPTSTGTYVGCVWSEYPALLDSQRLQTSPAYLTGSGLSFLAGRVSYTFGFQGEGLGLYSSLFVMC